VVQFLVDRNNSVQVISWDHSASNGKLEIKYLLTSLEYKVILITGWGGP
jgi:hypothetical protein